jgi:general stress protein 26
MDMTQIKIASIAPLSPVASSFFSPVLRRLALGYRRWAVARTDVSLGRVLSAARSTMRRKQYCLLVTRSAHGSDARVLQPFPPEDDFTVWLGTSVGSRKVAQLRHNDAATLVYQDDAKTACVVLVGRMRIVEEVEERQRRFMSTWWAFFPEGPAGSDFILLRFEPERIEVWDGARRVTPPPFGLRSAAVALTDGQWRCV